MVWPQSDLQEWTYVINFGQMCYRGFQPILYYGMTVDYLWIIGINGCSKWTNNMMWSLYEIHGLNRRRDVAYYDFFDINILLNIKATIDVPINVADQ